MEDLAPGAHLSHLTIASTDLLQDGDQVQVTYVDARGDGKGTAVVVKLLMAKLRNPLKPWSASDATKRQEMLVRIGVGDFLLGAVDE